MIYFLPTPTMFLVPELHCFPNDCSAAGSYCTSALPPFAFMCISPKNLTKSFTISCGSLCLLQNYSLPTPKNVTSLPKSDLPKGVQQLSLASLQDPSSPGKCTACVYDPKSYNFQKLHVFVSLICARVAVPAKIRNPIKQGKDQVWCHHSCVTD